MKREELKQALPSDGRSVAAWWHHNGDCYAESFRLDEDGVPHSCSGSGRWQPWTDYHLKLHIVPESIPPAPKPQCPDRLKAILLAADEEWQWVAIDQCGTVWVYAGEPIEHDDQWDEQDGLGALRVEFYIHDPIPDDSWQQMKWSRAELEGEE